MDYNNLRQMHARFMSSQAPAARVVEVREIPSSRALQLPFGNVAIIPGPRESFANAAPWHEYQHLLLGQPSSDHMSVMTPPPYPTYKALKYPPPDWHPSQTAPNHPVGVVGQGIPTMPSQQFMQGNAFNNYMGTTTAPQQPMSSYDQQQQVMMTGYDDQQQPMTGYDLQHHGMGSYDLQPQAMSGYDHPEHAMSGYDMWSTMHPYMAGNSYGWTIAPSNRQDQSNRMAQMQTPSYRKDELNLMPQMPYVDQPVARSASFKGKAPMFYDPTFQMMALSLVDPQPASTQQAVYGNPTFADPSNVPSWGQSSSSVSHPLQAHRGSNGEGTSGTKKRPF